MSYGRNPKSCRKSGRGGGIRTPDILLPKQVRYQTALHPVVRRSSSGTEVSARRTPNYRGWGRYWLASAADGGDSSRLGGGSSSAFLDRRTRPLSSASSTFTFTIWPSFR